MSVKSKTFGKLPDGAEVYSYTLSNGILSVEIISLGAAVRSLSVPDKNGKMSDIVLGYDSIEPYINDNRYFGKTIGQCCNRIKNGEFELCGERLCVEKNENGITCLHGADEYCERLWNAEITGESSVKMSCLSPDGEKGFPGNVMASVEFSLEENSLKFEYTASSDKTTVINMTNHSYFNLAGYDSGDITGHIMNIQADSFLPTDENNVPTGEIKSVEGTPFDFRIAKTIGEAVSAKDRQIKKCCGIDHNFCLNEKCANLKNPALVLFESRSGRKMSVYTDLPGIQIYTGNFLDGKGKNGSKIERYSGVAIETQGYPDAPNNPSFPSVTVKKGEVYHTVTRLAFQAI